MIGVAARPEDRRGFTQVGAAPTVARSPFVATPAPVAPRVRRGPFGGWVGRFRQVLGGTVYGQKGQNAVYRLPGVATLMPHRIQVYRKPAFWSPEMHYKRQEYLVSPPDLPGTAIQWTLFHPVYIPGLQGWRNTLPTNYFWQWARFTNFERWNTLALLNAPGAVVTGRGRQQNVWKPAMKVPQGAGTAKVFMQPRPFYTPPIVNLPRIFGGGIGNTSREG